jgi:YaaC-like Protein
MLDDTSMNWFRLRERRSSLETRSKLGDTNARKQTFAAAMGQFEEQFTAAKVVTAATRPLNLYYGLAQAGMAIAAAHAPDPWSFSRHGLLLGDRNPELQDLTVRPEGDGAFQKVAAATGSPGITEHVSLGALWASLPDLSQAGTLPGSAWRVPLELAAEESAALRPRATLYLPGEMPDEPSTWMARFGEMMAEYPSAVGYAIPMEHGVPQIRRAAGREWQVDLRWPALDSAGDMSEEELRTFFDNLGPEYRYRGDRFLRPAIDTIRSVPPSPLMTWWLLLYSFSILARYEPRRWAKLLDLDTSKVAALLQYALEEALTAVPHLVLEALDGEPRPLPKPIAL